MFTVCFALVVPEFNYITNLVGGFANNLVAIILPPIFYLLLMRKQNMEIKWWSYTLNIVVIVVGILAGLATTVMTLLEIFGVEIAIGIVIPLNQDPQECNADLSYQYKDPWI